MRSFLIHITRLWVQHLFYLKDQKDSSVTRNDYIPDFAAAFDAAQLRGYHQYG